MAQKGNGAQMVAESRFTLDHIQCTLYGPGFDLTDKLRLAQGLNQASGGVLDGDPAILPIPEGIAPEVPVLQLRSKDGKYSLSAGRTRIDAFFRSPGEPIQFELPPKAVRETMSRIVEYLRGEMKSRISRCSLVWSWFVETEQSPAGGFLFSKYLQPDVPIRDLQEIQIHFHSVHEVASIKANEWCRIQTLRAAKVGRPLSPFVNIYQDLNSLAEVSYDIDSRSLDGFLRDGGSEMSNTFKVHCRRMGYL